MKNRWIILSAGCLIQSILGGIYAWSTFVPYLMKSYRLSAGQCGFIFGVTILTFTSVMILSGWVLTKKGPGLAAGIGAGLFTGGYLLASTSKGSFPLLLLSLGVVVGAGIGFGYVCPLSVGMKWFPKKRGLVTGVAVAGFGGGAVLLSTIGEHLLLGGMDILIFFRWFAICLGVLLFGAAILLADPPSAKASASVPYDLSAVFTWPFGLTSIGMFAGTFAGLLIIGNLTLLVMKAGLTEAQAVVSVSIFAIGNALGRIVWGQLFDHLVYKSVPLSLGSFAVISGLLLLPLPHWFLLVCSGLLGFGFGANFVIYASALSRNFGTTLFPRLYPICFLAYGVAGLVGPVVGGYLADVIGSYDLSLYICIALVSFAGILSLVQLRVFEPSSNREAGRLETAQ